jgi:two-component system, NarL family, nitrate/nitrite response regulator NarL
MEIAVLGSNSLFRAGLVSLLAALGFERVSEAGSLDELKEIAIRNGIEVVLFHLPYETNSVTDAMKELRYNIPNIKVVFLSDQLNLDLMSECFSAGASGYLLQNLSRVALQNSLTLVSVGEKVFPSELSSIISDLSSKGTYSKSDNLKLSDRELAILRSLASGDPNKVIAAKLDIAESTVKVHLKRILEKTHCSNRTQAALWAVRHGIATNPGHGVDKNAHNELSSARDTVTKIPERQSG